MAKRKAEQLRLEVDFEGELQVDAALVPEIAARKLQDSKVAGRANVLIFPDLNSGNIASKLVRLVGHGNAYGQILLGLNRPAADVSRGSNAHDILGVAAIVGVKAINYQKLYPGADAHSCRENNHPPFATRMNTVTPRVFIAATRQNDGKTTASLGSDRGIATTFPAHWLHQTRRPAVCRNRGAKNRRGHRAHGCGVSA